MNSSSIYPAPVAPFQGAHARVGDGELKTNDNNNLNDSNNSNEVNIIMNTRRRPLTHHVIDVENGNNYNNNETTYTEPEVEIIQRGKDILTI